MTGPQLMFLGDSLIEFHDWQARFPAYQVVNRGRAGETVQGLQARIDGLDGCLDNADWFLLMIGTNNVAMEDYGFLPAYREIVATLRRRRPGAPIQLTSLLPLRLPWLAPDAIPRLNDRLRQLAIKEGAGYVDAHEAFTASGDIAALFLDDGVHLSHAGYTVWAQSIIPFLPPPGQP